MIKMLVLLVVSAAAVGVKPGNAPTYACVAPTDENAIALQDYAVRLTGGDPALAAKRQAYQLPAATPSQIQVVKTKSVCQRAAQAYNKAVRGASAPQVSRGVVVLTIGTTRYMVLDPAERQGEFEVTVIFDSAFTPLAAFNS
jgi:hypothetical protein